MSETEITYPKETINIENVVASTGIGQELDLQSPGNCSGS